MSPVPPDHPPSPTAGPPPGHHTVPAAGGGHSSSKALGVVLVLVVVGAVGGGIFLTRSDAEDARDADPRRQAYVDALAASATPGDFPGANEITFHCIAGGIVDVIGVDRLTAAATPDDIRNSPDYWDLLPALTEAEASGIVDGLYACWDVRTGMQEAAAEGGDDATAACLMSRLSDDQLKSLLVDILLDDPLAESRFRDAVAPAEDECGVD